MPCQYIATILIRIGEYETYTHYLFSAFDRESAMRHVTEGYDIGGDDFERVAEIYDITEVSEAEYVILKKYI
jgi:hypothetical protein